MLSRFSRSARDCDSVASKVAVAMIILAVLGGRFDYGRFVIYFDAGFVPKCSNNLVGSDQNLGTVGNAGKHLDIGISRDAGIDLGEFRFAVFNQEDALYLFLFGRAVPQELSWKRPTVQRFLSVSVQDLPSDAC